MWFWVCMCVHVKLYISTLATQLLPPALTLNPSFFVTCAAVQSRWTLVRVGKRVNWCVELYRTILYTYTYVCTYMCISAYVALACNQQFCKTNNFQCLAIHCRCVAHLINDWWSDLWICASSAMEGEIVRKLYKYIENITAVSCFIYVDITIYIQLPIYYKLFSKWVYSKWVYNNKKISHTASTDRNGVILTACAGHVCFQICVKFC